MTENAVKTHYRACNLCEAICGIEIRHRGQEILSIRGDKQDPFSQGHICPKAVALQDLQNDPDRLRRPLRKTANGWEEISWKTAFKTVARRLAEIQQKYGRNSVGAYLGNPTVHNLEAMLFGADFFRQLRTKNRYSATSVDQLPHHLAAMLMFGHPLRLPIPDIDRTDYMLILGANPVVSNGSIMTAPKVKKRLLAIQERGGKFITIDPRLTETAKIADRHVFIRPGSDAFLLMGMIQYLYQHKLATPGRLQPQLQQLDQLEGLLCRYKAADITARTGIEETEIARLVEEFCAAKTAVLYARIGVSTHEFGSLVNWLVNVFNLLTGNLDNPGGAMFTTPAIDLIGRRKPKATKYARYFSRVSKLPETIGELPVAALAEEILTPGEGQIKAMIVAAGNPLLSTPNNGRLETAFKSLEFTLSIDFYLNETSRHADIILPPPAPLERPHYDLVFNHLAVRNHARYSAPLFKPAKGSLSEAEIYRALTYYTSPPGFVARLKSAIHRLTMVWLKSEGILKRGIAKGPYAHPRSKLKRGLSFKQLAGLDHGLDLGPLLPRFPEGILTPNGKIQMAPAALVADLKRLDLCLQQAVPENSFLLIGRRDPRTCNSWLHNSRRMVKGKHRCTALLNPVDAKALDVVEGQEIKIESRVGTVVIPVSINAEMMPGVVSIPHGWGHGQQNTKLDIANQHAGISVNILSDEQLIDVPSGNAALNGVPVKIQVA